MSASGQAEAPPSPPSSARTALSIGLRVLVVGLIAFWLYRSDELSVMGESLGRLPLWTAGAALVLGVTNALLAVWRWRVLMSALGATTLPAGLAMIKAWLIGHFYNTFVPGSIGGDVARGAISRPCFERAATSFLVVVLERLIGLSALSLVFLAGLALGPQLIAFSDALPWLLGLLALFVAVLLGAALSGRLSRMFSQLPKIESKAGLTVAFGISVLGHLVNVALFWLFAHGLGLPLELTALLLIVPLALVAAVVPIAIAGIGPREVALVGLLGLMGIAKGEALALSLSFAALVIVIAAVGGLVQLTTGRLSLMGSP